jgi:hypothetical protein
MINRRRRPDGLPFRTYERFGKKYYSIFYKKPDGTRAWNLQCLVADAEKVRETRREGIIKAQRMNDGGPMEGSFGALADAWIKFQRSLPLGSPERRAESTLDENEREIAYLKRAFGEMLVIEMEKGDAYEYLDACLIAVDENGDPRPRPAKGNKEISLARVILEYGVRLRMLKENPFDGVEKLRTVKKAHYVEDYELDLAVEVGREMGGPQHIVALALKTAYLCLRRSVEVRAFTRPQITEAGIEWTGAKRQAGQIEQRGLIEWSPELRATIDEALAIERGKLAGVWYIFGNLRGGKYTKGGWKKTLSKLMDKCEEKAAERGIEFRKFSLQECRPKGVTDKLGQGHGDTIDATLHTSERMVRQVYDRRRVKVAKPAR